MRRRFAVASLLAALVLAACSSPDPAGSDGGPDDTATPDAASDAAAPDAAAPDAAPCALVRPYSTQNATCNACAEDACCAQVNGCLLDPACDDGYVNCALACALDPDAGQDPCLADCAAQYPGGKAAYDAAIGCVDQACAAECM